MLLVDGHRAAQDVSAHPEMRDRIARTIYDAGHHTTFQHAHVQFALENVSRHFIWSFLHSHPFYNSEQVSQRYVRVTPDQVAVPPLHGKALDLYVETVRRQTEAYGTLIELLLPTVERLYFERFPGRRPKDNQPHPLARRWIPKKAQEVARYVLPVATCAYLYHTVSVLTLLRYYRLCQQYDAPTETSFVVTQMVQAVLREDPLLESILEEPLPLEETLEYRFWAPMSTHAPTLYSAEFRAEFDTSLEGHTSKLVRWSPDNEAVLAQAVREVLGVPRRALSDDEAITLVLDPRQNRYFGESLNLTTLSKLTRTLAHPHYTFRKKLSHTADSQDQRHRMTPASRPALTAYLTADPDYITPALVHEVPTAKALYEETMVRTWEAINGLLALGVAPEYAAYLLPNAVSIRFTESADLLNLHHKLRMRLCYNAQEEIFSASLDEARQIGEVNPRIGRYLGAPCALRHAAGITPFCPEGDRYCGVPVWRLTLAEYERLL
ncbi:MAG: FAD-dependent thymidylate synthase [Ardenticatenia bacterium]|nr:FAD-dependent thymidylate synthase [Ardenticatenia bacterium]